MFNFFEDTSQPIWVYSIKVVFYSAVISSLLMIILFFITPIPESSIGNITTNNFLMTVLFAPLIETLLMIPTISISGLFFKNYKYVAAMNALIWAGFHCVKSPFHGIGVIWPFYLFSLSYLCWEKKSLRHALFITMLIHSLYNAFLLLISAFI